jgi:hypothetical protein
MKLNDILIYILFFFAGMWNAVMDTLKDYYSSSIWWNKVKENWNPEFSWKNKKFLGVMVLDPWHLSKTVMLWLICVCVYSFKCTNVLVGSIYIIYNLGLWFWNRL